MLKKIFESKADEMAGDWRKLCSELHYVSCSRNIIKERVIVRTFGMYGEKTSAYRVLVRMPEGKRPLARPRLRWEGRIRIILKQTNVSGVD